MANEGKPKAPPKQKAFDSQAMRWIYRMIYKIVPSYRQLSPHRVLSDAKIFVRESLIRDSSGKPIAPDVIFLKTPKAEHSERDVVEKTQEWLRTELVAFVKDCGYRTRQPLKIQLLEDRLFKGDSPQFTGWFTDEILMGTQKRSYEMELQSGKRQYRASLKYRDKATDPDGKEGGDKVMIGSTPDCDIQVLLGNYKGKLLYIERQKTKVIVTLLTSRVRATGDGAGKELNKPYVVDGEATLTFENYLTVKIFRGDGGTA